MKQITPPVYVIPHRGKKVHLAVQDHDIWYPNCGAPMWSKLTKDRRYVTCLTCRRKHRISEDET